MSKQQEHNDITIHVKCFFYFLFFCFVLSNKLLKVELPPCYVMSQV